MASPIPHRLHRVWLYPPGPPMPAEFQRYGERWRALHPTWECRDWDMITMLRPLVNQELYDAPPPKEIHRCRADVVRLEALWRYGGVYVDTDVEPVRALDPLLVYVRERGATAFIVWSPHPWKGKRLVSNAVISAVPQHPWIAKAMEGLPVSVAKHRTRFLAMQTVHYLTDLLGPLTDGVNADGLLVLGPETFFPRSIPQREAGEAVAVTTETYGIHHWANSRRKRR